MYDIVIVGAGPSGATLAALLDKKYKVLILDKRNVLEKIKNDDEDLLNSKTCGGMLAPNAQKQLASLNWTLPKDVLVSPQVYALKIIDIKSGLKRLYQRHYINVSRKRFDRWILDKALEHSEIKIATYEYSKVVEDGIEFSYMIDGKVYTEKTKLLIGADGAFSKVRNEFFSKVKKPKEYAAIQEWYRVEKPDAYYYGFADENVCDFYSWIIPKENYLILGSSIDDMKHANEKFEVLKNDLKRYGFNFTSDNFVKKEGSILFRPTSMRQIALGDGNVALIGEAAGIISPSSSEGIGYAIRCGACMAECLNENLDEGIKKYCKKAKKIARHAVRKKYRSFFLYKWGFFRRFVLKTKLLTIKEFDI